MSLSVRPLSWRVLPHERYETDFGPVAWLPVTLEYVSLPEAHDAAARSLGGAVGSREDLVRTMEVAGIAEPDPVLDDLIEIGLVGSAAPAPLPGVPREEVTTSMAHVSGYRISLTENCNFSCDGCFSTTALRDAGATLRTMSRETLTAVMQEHVLPTSAQRPVEVHFFGGEPLLRWPLMDLAFDLGRSQVEAGALRFSLTTNGSVYRPQIAERFVELGVAMGMSVELNPRMHDDIRKDLKGGGTWASVRENYLRYRDAGVDSHVLITPFGPLPDSAIDDLEVLMDDLSLSSMTINTPFDERTLGWLRAEEHLDFLVAAHRLGAAKQVDIDSALSPILGSVSHMAPRTSPQATLGNEVMVGVTPDGDLVRSTHKFTPAFKELAPEQGRLSVPLLHDDVCRSCPAVGVCGGPNEEFVVLTGESRDHEKCVFHQESLRSIAQNLDVFMAETDEASLVETPA